MMTTERISHEPQSKDAWVCLCGNMPHVYGFYPCLEDGTEVEPMEPWWRNLYRCDKCGRIINQDTLDVVGRKP